MSEEVAKKSSRAVWWIVGIVGIVLIGVVAAFFWFGGSSVTAPPKVTVAEYQEKIESKVNRELQDRKHPLRQYVEKAHVTVDVTQAYVSGCRVFTKNGTNIAKEGSKNNVRRVEMQISTRWDGIIDKGGKTVVAITLEDVGGSFQMTDHAIIKTTAAVNIDDPKFWISLGSLLGLLLL